MSDIRMIEITEKSITKREAIARGEVILSPDTVRLIREGKIPKGDVLSCAQVAGIMAVKKTPYLIPMCHPVRITGASINFKLKEDEIEIEVRVKAADRTGVEMEALTGLAVAGLTIYDMCKAVDRDILLSNMRLIEKRGGKSGNFTRKEVKEKNEGKNNFH